MVVEAKEAAFQVFLPDDIDATTLLVGKGPQNSYVRMEELLVQPEKRATWTGLKNGCSKGPITGLSEFPTRDFRGAVVYHLVYHASLFTHVNHLIMGVVYLSGLFMALAAPWSSSLGAYFVSSLLFSLCVLFVLDCGASVGLAFIVVPIVPALLFSYLAAPVVEEVIKGLGSSVHGAAAIGMGSVIIILAGLFGQVAAHTAWEEHQAPPALLHGFVVAPPLEWLVLWLRCGGTVPAQLYGVMEEANAIRSSSDVIPIAGVLE